MTSNRLHAPTGPISRGLIIAGLLLAAAAALRLLSPGHLSPELADRLLGILMGAVVVIYANAVPKAFVPLLHLRCDPVAEQAMRRFAGWALAQGGAAYAVAWAIAPLSAANMIAAILLGTALLLIIVRLALVMSRPPLS